MDVLRSGGEDANISQSLALPHSIPHAGRWGRKQRRGRGPQRSRGVGGVEQAEGAQGRGTKEGCRQETHKVISVWLVVNSLRTST